MQQDTIQPGAAVQQEIIDLLQYGRFNKVEIREVRPLERAHYPAHLARHVSDEGYEVRYLAERRIAPWDRSEIGTRRAHVGRLLRGPHGAMGLLRDVEEGPVHIEIDEPVPAPNIEEFGPF